MKRIFLLKGLDCPNCSAKIEKEVGELDGVQSSVVNLMKQTLTINVTQTAADTIASQIETIVHSHEPDVEVQEETVMNVTKSYSLKGLDCPNCSAKIEKEVGELDGVQSSVVNLMKQTLTINVAPVAANTIASQIETIVHSHEPDVEVSEIAQEYYIPAKKQDTNTSYNNEDKKLTIRLAIGAAIYGIGMALTVFAKVPLPVELVFLIVSYIILGGDVVWQAVRNISKGRVFDEHFLMSVSTIGAFVIGEYPEAVAVMLFYQVGEYFQSMAVDKSQKSIKGLLEIKADSVTVERNGEVQAITPEEINIGDIIVVKAGEKVCVDGVITKGESSFDMKALTGESVPVEKKQGDTVLSGSINNGAVIYMKAQKRFEDSTVARIIEMVENATANKSKTENFITKFAKIYTPVVVFLAVALTVLPTIVVGDFQQWLSRALVFLVASCPCALVLSVPLTFFSGIGAISKKGALVKGSTYLQTLSGLNTLVVDKTGTITKGEFTVVETDGEDDVMKVAASLERFSNHPIAQAIVKFYEGDYIDFDTTEEIAGYGLMGVKDGEKYFVGSQRLMERENVALSNTKYNIYVSKNNEYYGAIKAEDTIKPDSSKAIADLKALGVKDVVMLTGDKQDIAEEIGEKAGVTKVYAGLLPQGKVEKVEEIYSKNNNAVVGAVGDGINDAPVLARADVGIAMGGIGSDAAIEAADIVIMNDELSKLPVAIKYARMTMKTVKENVWFALGVKAVVLILAALGYANMWLAVFADVGVALLAILNATKVMRK